MSKYTPGTQQRRIVYAWEGEVTDLKAEIERLRAALVAERERCARHIDLIAADWREVGADQKVWASEYLARQIRELGDNEQITLSDGGENAP